MLHWLNLLTALLNHLFGADVTALMGHFGLHPFDPAAPIHNRLTLQLLVAAVMILFFIVVRFSLSVERPGKAQHVAEMVFEYVESQAIDIIQHDYERYLTYATVIGVFILLCNFVGLIPGIATPTSSPVVPLGLALLTFVYYNCIGLWKQGPVGYFKHFLGPVWWLTPLMLPMEIVSHLARILSLTVRLYANMFASDLLTLVFFSLLPIGIPVIFLGLHFLVAIIQAYVFMLLTLIYLAQAVEHEESL